MELKDAVARAKAYVADLFSDESIQNIGLEEVERDDARGVWHITVGFDRGRRQFPDLYKVIGQEYLNRVYKIVSVMDNGEVVSLRRSANSRA
jgi:hypothetical protein